jgi:hypothetical protein
LRKRIKPIAKCRPYGATSLRGSYSGLRSALGIPKGCQRVQAKPSPWNAQRRRPAPGKGARPLQVNQGEGLASLRDAVLFCDRFQGLRFACPWLPSRIPSGCMPHVRCAGNFPDEMSKLQNPGLRPGLIQVFCPTFGATLPQAGQPAARCNLRQLGSLSSCRNATPATMAIPPKTCTPDIVSLRTTHAIADATTGSSVAVKLARLASRYRRLAR